MKSHLLACLIVQNNHPTINSSMPNNFHASYNHIHGTHTAQKRKGSRKKGLATALKLGTYALSQSFSHASHEDQSISFVPHRPQTRDLRSIASHGDRSRSFVPHRPYVPVTGAPLSSDAEDLRLEAGTVCYVMVAGSVVPSMLHEVAILRWKATSISLYVQFPF